jgi:hypothetical protein
MMNVKRDTFITATREFVKPSCTHETLLRFKLSDHSALNKHYWITVFCEYDVSKRFINLFQKTSYILNLRSFLFVVNRLELRSLEQRFIASSHCSVLSACF